MSVTKLIVKTLSVLLLLAQRDARKAAEKQKQYKKACAARAKVVRAERDRLASRVNELSAELGTEQAMSVLGCNTINEAERDALTLARRLKALTE